LRDRLKAAALCLAVLAGALACRAGSDAVADAIRYRPAVTADCAARHEAVSFALRFEQGHGRQAASFAPSLTLSPVCDHSPEDAKR